ERFAVPWERMTLALRSSGTVEKLFGAPRVQQKTALKLGRGAFGDTVAATGVELAVESTGTLDREDAAIDVRLAGLVLDRHRVGDGHAVIALSADRAHPSIKLRFDGQGDAGPQGTLALDASFDGGKRALTYHVDGKLSRLGLLEPFLGEVPQVNRLDLGVLGVAVRGEGTLYGLVDAVRAGVPVMAPHPLSTLHGDDATELRLDHVRYEADDADFEVTAPALIVTTAIHADGDRRRARVDVEADRVTFNTDEHEVSIDGLRDHLELTASGDPLAGAAQLQHDVKARAIKQDFAAAYPIGGLELATHLEHDGATLRLTDLALTNAAGGTRLKLTGAIDLDLHELSSRRGFAVEGTLEQKLEGLSGEPQVVSGHGLVALALRVESGDLSLFHTMASLRVENAALALPQKHLRIEALDGEIPIAEDLVRGRHGFELVGRAADQTYPTLRFADQHPFLSGRSFLSMALLSTDSFTVGPLAGNLRIDRNLISLDQLEMAVRGGRVTGQCILDYRGAKSALKLRVRASHVEASHGGVTEPFDGNAALTVSLEKRSIEGRAEIIHIGRHHLLDLLDLYDPHHTDVPTNRLRKALGLGYPDRARLLFDRGFASLLVEFGGLAKLVRVDEVRGIPTGPLIDKYLGPLISAEGAP